MVTNVQCACLCSGSTCIEIEVCCETIIVITIVRVEMYISRIQHGRNQEHMLLCSIARMIREHFVALKHDNAVALRVALRC